MKKITINVDNGGNIHIVNIEGTGQRCRETTARMESRLGRVDDGSRRDTDELYKEEESSLVRQEGT